MTRAPRRTLGSGMLANDLANVTHQSLLSLGREMVVSLFLSTWRLTGPRRVAQYDII